MSQEIQIINLGGTNCYLAKTERGHVLIDTGFPFQRSKLEVELDENGCKPGDLGLIVITHGDIDHTGNCIFRLSSERGGTLMASGQ